MYLIKLHTKTSFNIQINNQNTSVASQQKKNKVKIKCEPSLFIYKSAFGLFGDACVSMYMVVKVQSCLSLTTQILAGVLTKQSLNLSNIFVVFCTATGVLHPVSCHECFCQCVYLINTSEICLDCSHLIHLVGWRTQVGKSETGQSCSWGEKLICLSIILCWGALNSLWHTNQTKCNIS